MSLSDNFLKYAKELVTVSNEIIDDWKLFNVTRSAKSQYLKKHLSSMLISEDGRQPYLMKASHVQKNSKLFFIEYHITFSISYGVPVLCLNIFHDDGSVVNLSEAWKLLQFQDTDNWANCLTQSEHPVLRIPFLTLHPCETYNFIQSCFKNSKNPLVSWLSAIGPTIGLNIPMEYDKLTLK